MEKLSMKYNIKDLSGQRFGRLVALEPTDNRISGHIVWKCQCDCGKTHYAKSSSLTKGRTKSCGCLRKEIIQETHRVIPGRNLTQKESKLKSTYGIMPQDYQELCEKQKGICANPNCNNPATDLDHDHKTGKIRGILCSGCNKSLGLLKEDKERIIGLVGYLNHG